MSLNPFLIYLLKFSNSLLYVLKTFEAIVLVITLFFQNYTKLAASDSRWSEVQAIFFRHICSDQILQFCRKSCHYSVFQSYSWYGMLGKDFTINRFNAIYMWMQIKYPTCAITSFCVTSISISYILSTLNFKLKIWKFHITQCILRFV